MTTGVRALTRWVVVLLIAALAPVVLPDSSVVPLASATTTPLHDGLILADGSPVYAFRADDPTTNGPMWSLGPCPGETTSYPGLWSLSWSPNGSQLAGLRQCETGLFVEVMDADGGNEHFYVLTTPYYGGTLTWSSTSDGLYVSEYGSTKLLSLVDGTVTDMVGAETAAAHDGHLAWWCDNQYDYTLHQNFNALCVYDPTTAATAEVTPELPWQSYVQPAWSPDSHEVAYPCEIGKLCSYDVTTATHRTLADNSSISGGAADSPVWSPDGLTVLFHGRDATDGGVFAVGADGTNPRFLRAGTPVAYSPTGQQFLVLGHHNGRTWTAVAASDGTTTSWLQAGNGIAWQPCSTQVCAGPRALTADCTVSGTAGADVLVGTAGDDVICAGGGNDRVSPGAGDDVIRGGLGTNTLDYRAAPHGVSVTLKSGTVTGWGTDVFFGFENVQGSAYDDVIKGDDFRNVLSGNAGNDDLLGYGGDDTLLGGAGNDYFRGGLGGDDIAGDDGSDRVSYSDSSQRVRISLASGSATGEGDDLLVSIERVSGSRFDDFIVGSDGRNVIYGGTGIDTIEGGGGADSIYGGDDKDYVYGQGGDDSLDGQQGADYLNGGAGNDDCFSGTTNVSC